MILNNTSEIVYKLPDAYKLVNSIIAKG